MIGDRSSLDCTSDMPPTADGEDPQVEVEYPPNYSSGSSSTLLMWLFIAAGFGAVVYFLRKAGIKGQGSILELRKSRARLASDSARITFSEVGGCVEAKEVLCDLVDFLKILRTGLAWAPACRAAS